MKHQADGGAIYTLSMQPDSVVSGNYIKDTPGPAYGAIYHYEGSRYFTSTQNALCNVDARWLFLDHGMNIDAQRNFTTQPVSLTQANSTDSTIANNAGLEPAYRYLDPPPAPADQLAPTTPGKAVVRTSFPTIADLIWPASTDAVSVTGKPPTAPATSWSPSNCSRISRSRTCGPATGCPPRRVWPRQPGRVLPADRFPARGHVVRPPAADRGRVGPAGRLTGRTRPRAHRRPDSTKRC
jgi:hypothetical protein